MQLLKDQLNQRIFFLLKADMSMLSLKDTIVRESQSS